MVLHGTEVKSIRAVSAQLRNLISRLRMAKCMY